MAVLGLHCWAGSSLVVASGGYSLVTVHWLLVAVASLSTEQEGFSSCDAWAESPQGVWGLPDQGLEP